MNTTLEWLEFKTKGSMGLDWVVRKNVTFQAVELQLILFNFFVIIQFVYVFVKKFLDLVRFSNTPPPLLAFHL